MVNKTKVLIYEKDNIELDYPEELELKADNISYDNTITGELTSDDTQGAIDEISQTVASSASPGFGFGKNGNITNGSYLNCEGVPSNISGRYVYISNAIITRVFISVQLATTFDIELYSHDGNETNLTLLGSVTVGSPNPSTGGELTVNIPVSSQKQLALRIRNGSCKNAVAGLELQGTN